MTLHAPDAIGPKPTFAQKQTAAAYRPQNQPYNVARSAKPAQTNRSSSCARGETITIALDLHDYSTTPQFLYCRNKQIPSYAMQVLNVFV